MRLVCSPSITFELLYHDSDAYDVERGALSEAKHMATLGGEVSTSIEFVDGLLRVIFVEYDPELAKKDRGAVAPAGG